MWVREGESKGQCGGSVILRGGVAVLWQCCGRIEWRIKYPTFLTTCDTKEEWKFLGWKTKCPKSEVARSFREL